MLTKAYVCIFVSFMVQAVHLQPVLNLTLTAFLATLKWFMVRLRKPSIIWSDRGTNFVGAANKLKALYPFLNLPDMQQPISRYCMIQNITWHFIPKKAPHFCGLWKLP